MSKIKPWYSAFQHVVNSIYGTWGEGRKLMAFYTGYFDESGHESQDILLCAGWVIDAENPDEFDEAWREAIAPLSHLHMKDFIAGYGEFSPYRDRCEEKKEILSKIAQFISERALQTFSSVLIMKDYRKADSELAFSEFVAYPFALCARFANINLRQWASRNSIEDVIKIVFENRPEGTGEVMELFNRDGLEPPIFHNKSMCPLQAADFLAWMHYGKILNSPNYRRMQSAFSELPAFLHTDDVISYEVLLGIARRIAETGGFTVMERDQLTEPVAFTNSPKRIRKKFSKLSRR